MMENMFIEQIDRFIQSAQSHDGAIVCDGPLLWKPPMLDRRARKSLFSALAEVLGHRYLARRR